MSKHPLDMTPEILRVLDPVSEFRHLRTVNLEVESTTWPRYSATFAARLERNFIHVWQSSYLSRIGDLLEKCPSLEDLRLKGCEEFFVGNLDTVRPDDVADKCVRSGRGDAERSVGKFDVAVFPYPRSMSSLARL